MTPRRFVDLIEDESARFHDVLASSDLASPVPPCPDWSGADLAWHLGEVHHFWRFVVEHRPEPPEAYTDPERPPAGEKLLDFARAQTGGLVAALRAAAPDDPCWSWHDDGESVGWTMRRQAHEALIHRVDAELQSGLQVSEPDAALAADGVDELVHVFLGDVPSWSSFEDPGQRLALVATDTGDRWTLEFGRFVGTSPNSGRSYDEPHARPVEDGEVAATVSGPAWALDLWLWGRAGADALDRDGASELPDRLREIIVTSTQ